VTTRELERQLRDFVIDRPFPGSNFVTLRCPSDHRTWGSGETEADALHDAAIRLGATLEESCEFCAIFMAEYVMTE
jgi:hypothetical protein